jgi:hypothetical protein
MIGGSTTLAAVMNKGAFADDFRVKRMQNAATKIKLTQIK